MTTTSHHAIRESLLSRIQSGEWELGGLIPAETALAEEYGCARTTVNRALRTLAEQGLVVRKRKGGTRIRQNPVRQARFNIPIVREQVEATGAAYRFELLANTPKIPPKIISTRFQNADRDLVHYMETLHFAGDTPFAFETRWLNLAGVDDFMNAPIKTMSINEWLVKSVPFSRGDVSFSAVNADRKTSAALGVENAQALFLIDRTTWQNDTVITTTKTFYSPAFKLNAQL